MGYAQGLITLVAAALALSSGRAEADAYKTARGLYEDCAAPATLQSGASAPQRARCADYLESVLNAWNLNQDNGVCSRHVGAELPDAYVQYWRARGLGFLSGEFRSAEASVNDFLDSQKQPCPPEPP
ncbi:MAG: hypothetical protein ACLQJR_21700 [Stellaceae bacterium]